MLRNQNFTTNQVQRGVKLLIELQTCVEALSVITDNKPRRGELRRRDQCPGWLA